MLHVKSWNDEKLSNLKSPGFKPRRSTKLVNKLENLDSSARSIRMSKGHSMNISKKMSSSDQLSKKDMAELNLFEIQKVEMI